MVEETDAQLARMRRALVKLRREGREREFGAVAEAYRSLKVQQMEAAEAERREAARARRAAEAAVRPPEGRWRLPRGFRSPLAVQRARTAVRPREEPRAAEGGVSPWREVSPMQERVWRP